jgi:hypothetical protein
MKNIIKIELLIMLKQCFFKNIFDVAPKVVINHKKI